MLAQLRKAYDIPSSVKLSLPRQGFRPSRPGSNEVVIHRQSFEYGFRLPIQPFFEQILSGLRVGPAQLSSMAWQNLAALYILWKEVLGVEPTIEDVHAIFALTTALKKLGLYYLRTEWTRDLSRDTDIKSVREYVAANPSKTDIVTEERLAKVGLIPPPSSGALGGEVPTPSSVTRRMVEGSKTDLAFLHLVREKMAKAAGIPSQRAAMGSDGSGKSASFLMSQFGDKLKEGSTSAGYIAKLEAQLSRLSQKAQVDRANELQASVDKLETEAGSNLLHRYHYAQYQVTKEYPDLDLHYVDFGFDREALVAKFGEDQNPVDAAGSSRQLTSRHPLNQEVSPPHSD
ncbi:Glyceraldehyde-3-phosphate dehydrogenase, testis-specific like [Melia azedarach]|uniref:Glyceraldehyde-3-phosphate dehydrogenase, testis-specific like n=1 Tax=Melia azedarach TaxID=155640 RepID=A0ACC1XQR3_MELAZ|nr:Glyceraldehyde-3-phosphate dehydrogenase, testis-specific like [Melia azedarach]